ncbi:MAG: DUF1499 domain-containing protein, partial [bacterium]
LRPCPHSPNCVSSVAIDRGHYIDPLRFVDPPAKEMQRLKRLIGNMRGARILHADEHYLRAEFRSKVFGFVDDVEFAWDESARICQVRSASRTGYYDFGKNRGRIEKIRRQLAGYRDASA